MKTKKCFHHLLTAAAAIVLSLGMGSCFDNVDNSTTPSDNQQQQTNVQQAKAQKFWNVVSQLADVDDYTVDYESMTFEPTYGVSQGTDEGTRYVYTNDAATAASRFADLVEQEGIDETTEQYTYSDPDVGTLVYAKGSGRILATVDVTIKQIPKLKKIVYVPGSYANAKFNTKAYYRFGDVVSRKVPAYPRGEVTEYWICVRPSFGPEGKGDSHWVCLNALPKKNVWYYSASNGNEYWLPTGIGINKEHMQNLAEMLYAIYFTKEWSQNIKKYAKDGLRMFHDFDPARDSLHNQFFWEKVRDEWTRNEILKKALYFDGSNDDFKNKLKYGLRLLCNGYSWWTMTSWDCTLYQMYYSNGQSNKEKNMHHAEYIPETRSMRKVAKVDCRKMGTMNYDNYKSFFYSSTLTKVTPYWTIRHATGKELASDKNYDVRLPIKGVEEVCRYYYNAVFMPDLSGPPEVTPGVEEDDDDDDDDDD